MTDKEKILINLLFNGDGNMTAKEMREEAERLAAEEERKKAEEFAEEERKRREKELKDLREFIADLKDGDIAVIFKNCNWDEVCLFGPLDDFVEEAMPAYLKDLGERLEKKLPELEAFEGRLIGIEYDD